MVDKLAPWFLCVLAQNVIIVTVQGHAVFLNVSKKLICAKDFSNLYELIIVVLALKEWLLLEYHTGKHASERPDVKTVIVSLEVNE